MRCALPRCRNSFARLLEAGRPHRNLPKFTVQETKGKKMEPVITTATPVAVFRRYERKDKRGGWFTPVTAANRLDGIKRGKSSRLASALKTRFHRGRSRLPRQSPPSASCRNTDPAWRRPTILASRFFHSSARLPPFSLHASPFLWPLSLPGGLEPPAPAPSLSSWLSSLSIRTVPQRTH